MLLGRYSLLQHHHALAPRSFSARTIVRASLNGKKLKFFPAPRCPLLFFAAEIFFDVVGVVAPLPLFVDARGGDSALTFCFFEGDPELFPWVVARFRFEGESEARPIFFVVGSFKATW